MRTSQSVAVAVFGLLGIVSSLSLPAFAQAPAVSGALGQPCEILSDLESTNPPKLMPIDSANKDKILKSGLPCQESVNTVGPDPNKTVLENLQRGFDFYSWRTFIALNSPADGSPIDKSKPGTKTKWEDGINFKQLLDVMLPDGRTPKWEDKIIPKECRDQYKDRMMVIEMIEESFNEPFKTGPLIDQQGNYAIFDILMDRQMFDYMLEHKLYSKAAQMSEETAKLKVDFPAGVNPPAGQTTGGDPGAVMIKVSWKVLDSEKDKQRFHTADALVLMPRDPNEKGDPPCLHKTLGLVGFHVGHKTKSRLQWIWTSFEHIDNVPEQQDVGHLDPNRSYNFYNQSCGKEKCPVNQTPPRPWDPTYAKGLKFHDSKFRSQITRIVSLTDETKELNQKFQGLLGNTVWKNYMLLSTQWPSDFGCAKATATGTPLPSTDFDKQPDMTCAPAPTYLANSTLETYSQGRIPLASSSCMDCHGNAVSHQRRPTTLNADEKLFSQSDFTFMLEKAR